MSHDIDVVICGNWPSPSTIQLECSGCGWSKNMGPTTSPEEIAEAESAHMLEVRQQRVTNTRNALQWWAPIKQWSLPS